MVEICVIKSEISAVGIFFVKKKLIRFMKYCAVCLALSYFNEEKL